MSRRAVALAFALALLVTCSVATGAHAAPIRHVRTVVNVDWTVAGIGGVSRSGTGLIQLHGVAGAVKEAYLYWHGINSKDIDRNASGVYGADVVLFNGVPVPGISLGDATTNCWGTGSSTGYRADVTALVTGDGDYTVSDLAQNPGDSPNGAALVVIFDDGNPANNKILAFFEGNDSSRADHFPGETDGWHATLFPVIHNGGPAFATLVVADGQSFPDGNVTFGTQAGSNTLFDGAGLFDGTSTPSMGNSRAGNGDLWDVQRVDITSAFGPAAGQWTLQVDGMVGSSDCLGLVAMIVETDAGVPVHGIQITQATQIEESLDDLAATLSVTGGDPPVALIAGKPTTARVSFETPAFVNPRVVRFEVTGLASADVPISIQPGCSPANQVLQVVGCNTANFSFAAPAGAWTLRMTVFDGNGNQYDQREFALRSRTGKTIELDAVKVCDQVDPATGITFCASNPAATLAANASMAGTIFPAARVTVNDSGESVTRDRAAYDVNGDGTLTDAEAGAWWADVLGDIVNVYKSHEGSRDLFADPVKRYVGVGRAGIPLLAQQGLSDGRPGRALVMRNPGLWDDGSIVTPSLLAHELGHTLGRSHTGVGAPSEDPATSLGCQLSSASSTDWPFSDNGLDIVINGNNATVPGYDPTQPNGGLALNPNSTYEIMGYCKPQWVSGFTYLSLLDLLASSSFATPADAPVPGPSWRVGGTLADGFVLFRPLVALDVASPGDEGTGDDAIEVRDAAGLTLARRRFTPLAPDGFDINPGVDASPLFAEFLPVDARAARIVVLDGNGAEIGRLELAGAAPNATVLFPRGGETLRGHQAVRWSIDDPDSNAHTSWVQYSPDGTPGSFRTLALDLRATSLDVDFDGLPGAHGRGVIRVVASDGIRSGSADSAPFTVPGKAPLAKIVAPAPGSVWTTSATVFLEGAATDAEDGAVDDAALAWTSDRDGALGAGRRLAVRLAPGPHALTLTATDRDGNTASDVATVFVSATAPQATLVLAGADVPHPSCVRATFGATPGDVPLVRAEYSASGGNGWTPVDTGALPFVFTVPGSGVVHVVVRVVDAAGQLDATDTFVSIETACPAGNGPPTANAGAAETLECAGSGGTPVVLDASLSTDPDGDRLTCRWSAPACTVADATACVTTATCPTGTSTITLVVNDGRTDSAPATRAVTVRDTRPPVGTIVAPPNGACLRGPVTIADDVHDACDAHLARTYTPAPGPTYVAEGAYSVTLEARDAAGNDVTSAVSFVIDDTAPTVRLLAPDTTQTTPRREPLARSLQTGDADAAPGGVVRERMLLDGCIVLDGLTYGNGDGLLVDESIDLLTPLFCRAYRACGRTDFTDPVLRAEADDCAGNTGSASVTLRGRFHVDASLCPAVP